MNSSNRDYIETDYYLLRDDENGDEKEFKLWVKASYTSSEAVFFNPMTGDGHPGSNSEIEIISVTCDEKDFQLTSVETTKLEEYLWDHLSESSEEDDDFNIEDERERQQDEERDSYDREYDGLDF